MSNCGCPPACNPCTPLEFCQPENFGLTFPSLVGPQGPPGGAGTFIQTIALLRLLDPTVFVAGYIAYVAGYFAVNDGGGGLFEYDPTSVEDDNNGTVIAPANGIGRWLRLNSTGFGMNPQWYGSFGDGLSHQVGAADSARFNAAFGIASIATDQRDWAVIQSGVAGTNPIVNVPDGTFLFNRSLELGSESGFASLNVNINGQSTGGAYNSLVTAFVISTTSDAIIHCRGDVQGLRIKGITFAITTTAVEQTRATVLARDVTAILVTGTAGVNTNQRANISDCNFFSVTRALSSTSANFQFDQFSVDRCSAYSVNDFFHCSNATNAVAHAKFSNCRIAYFRSGFDLMTSGPLTVTSCDGSLIEAPVAQGAFFRVGSVANLKIVNCSHEDFGAFGTSSQFILTVAGGGIQNITEENCVSAGNHEFNSQTWLTCIGGSIGGTSFVINALSSIFLIQNDPTGRPAFTGTTVATSTITNLDGYFSAKVFTIGTVNFLNNALITSGTGSPEGVITAKVGSYYIQTDGTFAAGNLRWLKGSGTGNTGWVRDLINGKGAMVLLTAAETCTTAVEKLVPWDADYYTDLSVWAIGNPTRLVVPAGVTRVRLTAGVSWAANATGQRQLKIYSRGGAVYPNIIWASDTRDAAATGLTNVSLATGIIRVQDIAYFELAAEQNSGGNLDLNAVGGVNNETFFNLEVIQ